MPDLKSFDNHNFRVANRGAWIFFAVIYICHVLSLPLYVNFDSQWYVRLAEILGTHHYPVEWDFLRTPVFPALLKFAFWLWGRQAMAVFGLQAGLACAAIWLLTHRLRTLGLSLEAAIGVAVLGAFPTLIAYEHVLLTEVGSFFFFSLLVFLVVQPEPASLSGAIKLAFALGVGYYHRASLLYLAPVMAGIYVIGELRNNHQQARRFAWRVVPLFLIVAIVPFLLAYPWQRNPKVAERNGHVLLFGLVKQGVLPLHDPILGATAPVYAQMIEESKSNGVLPNSGLKGGRVWSVMNPIYNYGPVGGAIFRRAVLSDPLLYLQAVARNLKMFLGIPDFAYDNAFTRQIIFASVTSQIDPGPPWIAPLGNEFKRTTTASVISVVMQRIAPIYDWMVSAGLLATLAMFLVGLWRVDQFILAFTAPALAFIALHALLLVSQDRMILPVQPILLLNLILVPTWLHSPTNRFGIGQITREVRLRANKKETSVLGVMSRFGGDRLLIFGILFLLVVGLPIGIGVATLLRSVGAQRATIKELGIRRPTQIKADLFGYISTVNGNAPSEVGDEDHPDPVPAGYDATLEGWFAYGDLATAVAMDQVFGVVDGTLVKAEIVDRPDVANAFKNPKLAHSGYRLNIETELLRGGPKRIDMIGRVKEDGKLHRFPRPFYLVMREIGH